MSSTLPASPFYFLRHGVTDHNLRRLVMGQLDIPLNALGRRQAERAALLAAPLGIAAIVCSPLRRARETAEIVGVALRLEAIEVEALRERDWGEMSGRPYRELTRRSSPAGAESAEGFRARVLGGWSSLGGPAPLLIVAHSGVCRVFRRHFALDNVEAPVPHAVPLRFASLPGGGWTETAASAEMPVAAPQPVGGAAVAPGRDLG